MTKKIKETKCTCISCGNTWYYGKQDVLMSVGNDMQNIGKDMMCCTGCIPAAFIPDKQKIDLKKCNKCGSKAIKSEEVIHDI